MRSMLLVESFYLCPSNQYILVRVIPSCENVFVLDKYPVKVWPKILDIIILGELHVLYGPGAHFSSCGECDVDRLGSVSFYSPFLNHFWFAVSVKQCQVHLSVASTALSSVKVAVVDSHEVGRSAVYSRYNTGLGTLPQGMPALTGGVLCTQFQPLRGSVCYASRSLGQGNN
jgi:hypothetical protein